MRKNKNWTKQKYDTNTAVIFLGAGLMIGAVLTLWFAPRVTGPDGSGSTFRGELANSVEERIEQTFAQPAFRRHLFRT